MKFTVILDENRDEEIIIYAKQKTKIIEKIENLVKGYDKTINGYSQGEVVKLNLSDIYCFCTDGGKLYAICEKERYLLKTRLYMIEELLGNEFIKINQSSIANINKIQKFDVSIGGTLKVILKNGYTDYVSRRNLKFVKERLGL